MFRILRFGLYVDIFSKKKINCKNWEWTNGRNGKERLVRWGGGGGGRV